MTDTTTSDDDAATAAAPASLLRNRNFLLLWSGQATGALGPQVALIALPLLALQTLHASTFEVSLLTFFGWLPYLLFSLPAGAAADRWNQRAIMIACDVSRMVLLITVPALALDGILTLWYLYLVVGISGVLTVLFTVSYRAQLPRLVSSTQLIDGNGKLGMGESLAEIAGPAVSGLLVGLAGAARTLFLNVATYGISAVTLGLIRVPPEADKPVAAQSRVSPRVGLTGGLSYVVREPIMRSLLAATCVSNFFVIAAAGIEVTFMIRTLHASPSQVGLVFAAGSLGGVFTGAFTDRIASWARQRPGDLAVNSGRRALLHPDAAGPARLGPDPVRGWTDRDVR